MSSHVFIPTPAEPLDGSPMISDNCWKTMLDSMREQAKSKGRIHALEWGAGNSTIAVTKLANELPQGIDFTSIEHETVFFPVLAESVIKELQKIPSDQPLHCSWHELAGPIISFSELGSVLKENRQRESTILRWQILSNNKRLEFIENAKPNFRPSFFLIAKQFVKLTLIKANYIAWIGRGLLRSVKKQKDKDERYDLKKTPWNQTGGASPEAFFSYFTRTPKPGCIVIERGNIRISLWHLPVLSGPFWKNGVLLDGTFSQLPDYINAPFSAAFDWIFIDGRARVSCIKRVAQDKLLAAGGWLFVHDAFRAEMVDGFRLLTKTCSFIDGSNRASNGQIRCATDSGQPLIKTGPTLESLQEKVLQELFVYQNV